MDISIENKKFWEDAINLRRSVRSFERKAVDPIIMESLKDFAGKINISFQHVIETVFFKTRENQQLANNLKKPPEDGVAFITQSNNRAVWKPQFPNSFHPKCSAFCGLVR